MKKFVVLVLLVCSQLVQAQVDTLPNVFLNPRDAVYNHLFYLQEDTFNDMQSAKSLARTNRSRSERAKLAMEIKQVLDGRGIYIIIDDIPDDEDYIDSLTNEHRFVLSEEFPEIYLQKYGRAWLFSQETVRKIEGIHDKVFPFGASELLKNFNPNEQNKFIGIYYWQYAAVLILTVGLILIYRALLFVLKRVIIRMAAKWLKLDYVKNVFNPLAAPLALMAVFYILFKAIPVLQLSPFFGQFIIGTIKALFVIFLTGFLLRTISVFEYYGVILAKNSDNSLDDHLVPLISKVIKGFTYVFGFILMLNSLGVDILPLLTGLSIGGLAFALAAQDTIKNFFGSLMIFLDKPFEIGDWVTDGEIDGTVEDVGLRSTRIRTFRDSLLYVPNDKIANGTVDNHGARRYRRFFTNVNITYDTPARVIEVFVAGIRRIVDEHPDTRKDYYNIYLNDYENSSLKIMLYVFFAVPTWPEELRCRQEIMLEVNKLAEHLGVRFAFPTQTLHVEQMPGQLSLTPKYEESAEKYREELDQFFDQRNKK